MNIYKLPKVGEMKEVLERKGVYFHKKPLNRSGLRQFHHINIHQQRHYCSEIRSHRGLADLQYQVDIGNAQTVEQCSYRFSAAKKDVTDEYIAILDCFSSTLFVIDMKRNFASSQRVLLDAR